MDVEIAARHVQVTEPMERHIRQRIERLPRFREMIRCLTVTLRMDSGSLLAEVIAKCPRAELVAEAKSHDMYKSIDDAFAKIEHRLTRYHDKLVSSRAREGQKASETGRRPDSESSG